MSAELKKWLHACRLWSLTASVAPFVACAPALFYLSASYGPDPGPMAWPRFFLALLGTCTLQIACNLLNTVGDYLSGVDRVEGAHVSVPVLLDGSLRPRTMCALAIGLLVFGALLAICTACLPSLRGGHINLPMLLAALAGILGASNYTTGIKFKYRALGLPFVFLLMGPLYFLGVGSAYFGGCIAPAQLLDPAVLGETGLGRSALVMAMLSVPVGMLVACIMHGNDMRDIISDAQAGIKTASTLFGPKRALNLYQALHFSSCASAIAILLFLQFVLTDTVPPWKTALRIAAALLPALAIPVMLKTIKRARHLYENNPARPGWKGLEEDTGKIHFLMGWLYALGLIAIMLIA